MLLAIFEECQDVISNNDAALAIQNILDTHDCVYDNQGSGEAIGTEKILVFVEN